MDLQEQINELRQEIENLKSNSTLPKPVEDALRERLRIGDFTTITTQVAKGATSENQSVNEAGMNTYSVLKPPDAFLLTTINGTAYYISAWTA